MFLNLIKNGLIRKLSSVLQNLTTLTKFQIFYNNLTKDIPNLIVVTSSLFIFNFNKNNFSSRFFKGLYKNLNLAKHKQKHILNVIEALKKY